MIRCFFFKGKGRLRMTRAVSKEIREKIVNAYKEGYGTIAELGKIFGVNLRTVAKYLKLDRDGEDLEPKKQPGRPAILTEENLSIIKGLVLAEPDGTLEGYRAGFYEKTGLDVTIVTIHNACKRLNLRRKKRVFSPRSRQEPTWLRSEQISSMR